MKLLMLPLAALLIYSCGPSDQAKAVEHKKDMDAFYAELDSSNWALEETVRQMEWENKMAIQLIKRRMPKAKQQPYIDSIADETMRKTYTDTLPAWYIKYRAERKQKE